MVETLKTQVYRPCDIVLYAGQVPGNPFDVEAAATFVGPSGERLHVPGFYAGDGRFRIRFAPTREGRWSYVTHCALDAIDGITGAVEAGPNTNPRVHGSLQADPKHPHHLLYQDGTRPFLMGYECDWLWALDQGQPDIPHIRKLVDLIAEHNFSLLITQAYAHHCSWSTEVETPAKVGPPRLLPWAATNHNPDYALLTIPYWDHYDRMMDYLLEKGITVFLMIRVYNKFVRWPENSSADDDRWWRYIVARYQAYPNVVWVLAKEAHNEQDRPGYWQDRIRFIRAHDAYGHLITTHDDDEFAHTYDLDLRFDQHHKDWNEHIISERKRRQWPVMNVEFGYEPGPIPTYAVHQPIEEVVRRAWLITAGGGYLAYYYSDTAWDVITFDEPPGYDCFAHLHACMSSLPFYEMEPHNELVDTGPSAKASATAGYCLAQPGRCYLVFLDDVRQVTLSVQASGHLPGRWLDPMTGEWTEASQVSPGKQTFTVPPACGKLAVLIVGEES